jgi:LytR cell envelope-related transcriptional attenuator
MDIVERVGAYVGIAAFLGLAILALLYFSQARDVRRLREWAGRAPERAEGIAATQHYLPPTTIEEASKRKRVPLRERLRRIHVPQARYVALVVGGIVIIAGAGLGALQLVGGDDDDTPAEKTASQSSGDRGRGRDRAPAAANIDPSQVTVAVLNGTTIAGLAAQVGEEANADGFTLGTVTNAARTDQSRTEVLYREGQKDAAMLVADRLGIRAASPVDTLTSELAGSFDVVVLVGSDRANQ